MMEYRINCIRNMHVSHTHFLCIILQLPPIILQVDVIVNSTDSSLDLNHGALSTSILEAGGTILRDECKKNAPDGIKCGEVVVTSGGQMPCQYVIHGLACSWDDGQCKKVMSKPSHLPLNALSLTIKCLITYH